MAIENDRVWRLWFLAYTSVLFVTVLEGGRRMRLVEILNWDDCCMKNIVCSATGLGERAMGNLGR